MVRNALDRLGAVPDLREDDAPRPSLAAAAAAVVHVPSAPPGGALRIELLRAPETIAEAWRHLERHGDGPCFARLDWTTRWIAHEAARGGEPAVVAGYRGDRLAFVWPLVVRRHRGVRVAGWLAGAHSNVNLGLYAEGAMARLGVADVRAALDRVARDARVDAFVLERQPFAWEGVANPLVLALSSVRGPSDGYVCRLEHGFDHLLAARKGASKRKRMRYRERGFDAAGGWRFGVAEDANEAAFLLDTFFEQKAQRFARLGIPDSFSACGVRATYHGLIGAAAGAFELVHLTVGDRIRAVAGQMRHGSRLSVLFLSFADDDLARYSPGEALVYRLIERAAATGARAVDFGLGEARFKASWCEDVVPMAVSTYAATTKGRIFVAGSLAWSDAKRRVKQSPRLFAAYKQIRRITAAGRPPVAGETDDDLPAEDAPARPVRPPAP
jgi:CelD/BcsL family acetyltransferase involved in cellulose biosynthesis